MELKVALRVSDVYVGMRRGRLTVTGLTWQQGKTRRYRAVTAACRCGSPEKVYTLDTLRSTVSCGCWHREESSVRTTQRNKDTAAFGGLSAHREWQTHKNIMQRCYDQRYRQYKDYGGRGILLYGPWHDPGLFISETEAEIGPRPDDPSNWDGKHPYWTLDRINNNGNYEPGNIRWADWITQRHNRRSI